MPRAVSEKPNREPRPAMAVLGWIIAAGSLLLLLPVLPFIAVVRLYDALTDEGSADRRPETGSGPGRRPGSGAV